MFYEHIMTTAENQGKPLFGSNQTHFNQTNLEQNSVSPS